MIRKAFVMQLNKGCRDEYERRHNPIWPELQKVLRAHGSRNYSIFLDPASGRLFGYVEIEDEKRWQAVAGTAICQKWWAHMRDLMSANPDNSPVTIELQEVFHLD